MIPTQNLFPRLSRVHAQFESLQIMFSSFAAIINKSASWPNTAIQSISIKHENGSNLISISFESKQISMIFTPLINNKDESIGRIKSYLKLDFPEDGYLKFNEFDFNTRGLTNHPVPDGGDKIDMSYEDDALMIALNIIHQALSCSNDN